MSVSFELAQAFLKDAVKLNQVAKDSLVTKDLEANQVQFVGANTVKLPVISYKYDSDGEGDIQPLTTLSAYSRTDGFVPALLNLSWDTFTLTQDKGNSLKLDAMDDEEGLGQALIPFAEEYIRTLEVPAIDKYRLHKLVYESGNVKDNLDGSTADKLYGLLTDAFAQLTDDEFSGEGLILYITPSVDNLLQTSSLLSRYIRVDEFTEGKVKTKIRYFNDAKIVVVPESRYPADFGGETELVIYFILVDPTAQLSVVKHKPANFYAEGSVPGFDGSQLDMRVYHDTFVLEQRNKGIYVAINDVIKKVTFDTQGGSEVPVAWVKSGKKVKKPADPVKAGYEFDGWFTQKTDGSEVNFASAVSADKTVYAQWSEESE